MYEVSSLFPILSFYDLARGYTLSQQYTLEFETLFPSLKDIYHLKYIPTYVVLCVSFMYWRWQSRRSHLCSWLNDIDCLDIHLLLTTFNVSFFSVPQFAECTRVESRKRFLQETKL